MGKYGYLTEDLRDKTLKRLEEYKQIFKERDYPTDIVEAIEIAEVIAKSLPKGMIVPLSNERRGGDE